MDKKKESKKYNKSVDEIEEIRDGFKVSSNRKKVWNIQLGILEQIKKICEKHDIKYFADAGTLLGSIRHKGYIPRDDDMDIVMFRNDYEKFLKIAEKELPGNIKIWMYHLGFAKLVNINTTALTNDYRRNNDFKGGIRVDIFPIDYSSKYMIINRLKYKILGVMKLIIHLKQSNRSTERVSKRRKYLVPIIKLIFNKYDGITIYQIHEKISKTTIFKGKDIYNGRCPYLFYPENIYNGCHNEKFENTIINIPNGYDTYLTIKYGNYMKPIIFPGGHNCRYSVDKSYKEIIKTFDKSKSNEENYKNCKDLFVLD